MTQEIGPEDQETGPLSQPRDDGPKRRSIAWPWLAMALLLIIIIWLIWQFLVRAPSAADLAPATTTTEVPLATTDSGTGVAPDTSQDDADVPDSGAAVPDVVGLTRSSAVSAINSAGYKASVTTVYGTSSPANTVIHQNPSGGSTLAQGDTVGILVQRRGRKTAVVADFLGLSQAEATRRAKAAGFKVVISYFQKRHGMKTGVVHSQWPSAGKSLVVGGDVQLQIVIRP